MTVPQLQSLIAQSDAPLQASLEHFLHDALMLTSAMKGLQNRSAFRAWWTHKIEVALAEKKLLITASDEQLWQEAMRQCARLNTQKLKWWSY